MSKYTKKDPERLELVARCCICGRLFYRKTHSQTACNLWLRPGKRRSACVHERAYIDTRKRYNSKHRIKRRTVKPPRSIIKETIKAPSGCKLVQTDGGRCLKYADCAHKSKCLMAIPLHWKGFNCDNGCPGYAKDTALPEMYSDFDYDTTWEVGI